MEQKTNERKNGDWKAAYDYSLHLVTDRAWMSSDTLSSGVEQAILGGRETGIRDRDFYQLAMEIKEMTDRYEIPLIINNRIDIALASGAAGVHIGQKDLPLHAVRQSLGRDMCIGVSVTSVEEVAQTIWEWERCFPPGAKKMLHLFLLRCFGQSDRQYISLWWQSAVSTGKMQVDFERWE